MVRESMGVRDLLAVDYRMACPYGHTSLHPATTTPTAYCQTCGQSYAFEELVDRHGSDVAGPDS